MQVLILAANAWGWVKADWARMLHECADLCARIRVGCREGNHALSLQEQEVEEERQLDFQRLRAYHYQRVWLKTLHAIAEGVTTRLAGRQEMPAPNLGYRSGAYQAPTWVPFQVSRAAQACLLRMLTCWSLGLMGLRTWILVSSFMRISVTVMMCRSCRLAL